MFLEKINDAFVAAALDPSRWDAAAEAAAAATGSFGALVMNVGPPLLPNPPATASVRGADEDYLRDGWVSRDGLNAFRAAVRRDAIAAMPSDFEDGAFYNEFLLPRGVGWFASIKVTEGPDCMSLALHRTPAQGPFTYAELEELKILSPRLVGIMELAKAFEFKRVDDRLDVWERSGSPVMMIDMSGDVLRLNPCAERMLSQDLQIVRRRLVSWSCAATRTLDQALHKVIRGSCPSVGPVVLPRRCGRPVIAHISRFSGDACFSPARAIIVFADLEAQASINVDVLMAAFGLARAEARLTSFIAHGMSLQGAASELGVAVGTVRNQIKRVFEKTATNSQGQLISLISRLHPLW